MQVRKKIFFLLDFRKNLVILQIETTRVSNNICFKGKIAMTLLLTRKLCLFLFLLTGLSAAAKDLVLFGNGQVAGKLGSKASIRENQLVFENNKALKLIFEPAERDLSRYGSMELEFNANRAGDFFRFTATVQPRGEGKPWLYFYTPNLVIPKAGEQKMVIDLDRMGRPGPHADWKAVHTLDFHFTGWEMPAKKGLVLQFRRIALKERGPMPSQTAAESPAAAEVKAFAGDTKEKRTIFRNGSLAGTPGNGLSLRKGCLVYSNSKNNRLTIRPANRDLSGYDILSITFTPNRSGDSFRLTATSNPEKARKWNYYYDKIRTIQSTGKQTLRISLREMGVSRTPVGWNDIQSMELCFAGWDMPYRKGLLMTIEEIALHADVRLREKQQKTERALTELKKATAEILPLFPMRAWIPVPPASDRSWWNAKRNTVYAKNLLNKHIQPALQSPAKMPSMERYMDFRNNGNRTRYEQEYAPLVRNFENLTMALCLTGDREKYLTAWVDHAKILASMPTWVLPAHDADLRNYSGRNPSLELVGTGVAAAVMQARQLLKGWIPEDLDRKLEAEVLRQILTPFLNMVKGKRSHDWFAVARSNWNSVCFANLLRALLASELPPEDKQSAIEYALIHIRNYLAGFQEDGYCSEGISYWSYGYGHYLIFAATVYCATNGKVNLVNGPEAARAAMFPEKFMLSPDYFPAFSDTYFAAGVSGITVHIMNYLLGKPVGPADKPAGNMAYQLAFWGLPPIPPEKHRKPETELISAFPASGVFIFRSSSPDALRIGLKGGNNDELHNHNDLGSYSLSYPLRLSVLGDLGKAVYTRDSFNARRYENPILNSYGHPVPLIDGHLQSPGKDSAARVKVFRHDTETAEVVLDLKKAYPQVPGLQLLERSFRYRFADGETIITDMAKLIRPAAFETALTTFGTIEAQPDGSLLAKYRDSTVRILIDTGGVPWSLKKEALSGNAQWPDPPYRYAIVPEGKRSSWKIEITFQPVKQTR